MWISRAGKERPVEWGTAQVGRVTLEGDPAAACAAEERRNLPVFGPGGYCWRPALDQEVLVLKTGDAGEESCVAGARCAGTVAPGEVYLFSGGGKAAIRLYNDGTVAITGRKVMVNGVLLSQGDGESGENGESGADSGGSTEE